MKKRLSAILLLVASVWPALPAASGGSVLQGPQPASLPAEYEGSMMPYDFAATDSVAAYPDTLATVGVLYVARHGSRFMSSPGKFRNLQKILYEAGLRRRLSRQGERMLALLGEVERVSAGRWGELSPLGIAEEERLGADMQRRHASLLKGVRVEGASTFVPRAMMTMYEFMHAMEIPEQSMRVYTSSGTQNDTLLRCFEAFADYSDYRGDTGAWNADYEKFVRATVPIGPARRILSLESDNNKPKLRELTMEIYGVLQSLRAMGLRPCAAEFFTDSEYRACWEASNLRHWFRNTETPLSGACSVAIRPLVERLVTDGNEILTDSAGRSVAPFRGYFGHAETLLPLLSALNVPGCRTETEDYGKLAETWRIQEITPLGANLEIMLLRGPSGAAYAALRLNGRNVEPYPGCGAMFAPWSALSDRWLAPYNTGE